MPEASPRSRRLLGVLRSERLFVIALIVGAVLRAVVQYAFPPAFVFSDGPNYLAIADDLRPVTDRPVGYSILLHLVATIDRGVDLVVVCQHLIGLATAVVVYALLRRRGVGPVVATLATLPLLLDAMQLVLEHSVLSDVVFCFLLVVAVAVLLWRPVPRLWATAATGLLLGVDTVIRVVGGPTVVVVAVFLLLALGTWRARIVHVVAVGVMFAIPVAAYASWYHHDHGAWSLTQSGGRALYMRTTSFVDCDRVALPAYERTLCPISAPDDRGDPTFYGFHATYTIPRLEPPAGMTKEQAERDFAERAIKAQPLDYLRIVGRDFAMPFVKLDREDFGEYSTAKKWTFDYWVDYVPTDHTGPAYAAHGGQMPSTRHPVGEWWGGYGRHVFVPGPLFLAMVVLAAAGAVVRRRGAAVGRTPVLLCLALPLALILVPDVTAQFTWRYQLPLISLLPTAAALGWARLAQRRARPEAERPGTAQAEEPAVVDGPGTVATPSTD